MTGPDGLRGARLAVGTVLVFVFDIVPGEL